ncbi:MAG: hypothetical protein ROY99_04935 [Ignavibacterium sp.]|jgi:hypothetical protein|nr:hypothetical protein [Ignavibacterium sp.]
MVKKKIEYVLYLIVFIQLSGCTYNVSRYDFDAPLTFYDRVNELCYQQEVNIVTDDSSFYFGTNFIISDSTSSFFNINTGNEKIILTQSINYLAFKSHSYGLLKNATAGAIAGVGLGLFLGQFSESLFGKKQEVPALLYVPIVGIAGAVITTAIIWVLGNEVIIKFE